MFRVCLSYCLVCSLQDILVLVYAMFSYVCHFPIGVLGESWYLIVSIPDLCIIPLVLGLLHLWLPMVRMGQSIYT